MGIMVESTAGKELEDVANSDVVNVDDGCTHKKRHQPD